LGAGWLASIGAQVAAPAIISAKRLRRHHAQTQRGKSRLRAEAKKLPFGRRCQQHRAGKCSTGACDVIEVTKRDPFLCSIKPAWQGKTICCRPEGQTCALHCECCGTMLCNNGVCGEACTAIEALCALGTNCCAPSGGCGPVTQFKADGSICGTPETQTKDVCCVLSNGAQCAGSCQCCGDEICLDGRCQEPVAPPPAECIPLGQDCRLNGPACCNGVPCHNNRCQFPPPPCTGSFC
jgi:hypothetical protein